VGRGFYALLHPAGSTRLSYFTIASFLFSKRLNSDKKKSTKHLYIRESEVNDRWIEKEKSSIRNLKNGNIKCHLLRNSSPVYNVKNWVIEMRGFFKKPVSKELFLLEGKDVDEEY
jgi:hypothetical protein